MNKEIFEENDRNIRVFGLETMKKLFETEVLILGFTPAMTELSKNLILSGAGICLFDSGIKIEKKDTENNFVFNSPMVIGLRDKIYNKGILIKDLDIEINYGIKTGYNPAFWISSDQYLNIVSKDEHCRKMFPGISETPLGI